MEISDPIWIIVAKKESDIDLLNPGKTFEEIDFSPVFIGSLTECKAILFDLLRPSEICRNIINHNSDSGYWYSYERMHKGKWEKIEIHCYGFTNDQQGMRNVVIDLA